MERSADALQDLAVLRRKMRRQLLRDLFHGVPLAGSTLEEINQYYGYQLRPGVYNILMIRLHAKQASPSRSISEVLDWVDEDARMFFTPENFLEFETLAVDNALYCMFHFDAALGSQKAEDIRLTIDRLFHHMDCSRRYRPYYFAMGDGLPTRSLQDLGACFLSAQGAVEEYGIALRTNRRNDSTVQMYAMTQIMTVLDPPRRASFSHYLETAQEAKLFQWVDDAFRDCGPYLDRFPTIAFQLPYKIFDLCLESASKSVAADPELQQILINCKAATDEKQDYNELCTITKDGLLRFCTRYALSTLKDSKHAVSSARAFMWNNYARKLSLEEIASHAHLNPQYFSVLFKRETGESVVDYLTNLRIEQAKTLLKETLLPINELAQTVGYEDPDYFSRVFRKRCGISPRQYRNAFTGN